MRTFATHLSHWIYLSSTARSVVNGLFRVECGHADLARVLGIDVEVPDDERTLTSAHTKDLDNAQSYVPLLDVFGPVQPV